MKKPSEKPSAIRLGNLKTQLQAEAMRIDRSLNYVVKLACEEYLKKCKKKKEKL